MNLKKLLFLCLLSINGATALFAAANNDPSKKNYRSFLEKLSKIQDEKFKKHIGKITGNVLIPLITTLICAYDYASFKPKNEKLEVAENQEDPKNIDEKAKQKEEKPSKFKAYLADLKAEPYFHTRSS